MEQIQSKLNIEKAYLPKLIAISMLNQQDYCEYKIVLKYIKRFEDIETEKSIEGTEIHNKLEASFLETVEKEPITFSEGLDIAKTTPIAFREFQVVSINYGIIGIVDELRIDSEAIIVIDDKPGRKPFNGSIKQVYGYCLAIKERNKSKTIFGAIRERDTNNIIWHNEFNAIAESEVIWTINRVHGIIAGTQQATSSRNPNKCLKCNFNSVCDRRIT